MPKETRLSSSSLAEHVDIQFVGGLSRSFANIAGVGDFALEIEVQNQKSRWLNGHCASVIFLASVSRLVGLLGELN
jgi:hypothetical protein